MRGRRACPTAVRLVVGVAIVLWPVRLVAAPDEIKALACGHPGRDGTVSVAELAQAMLVQSRYPLNDLVDLARTRTPDQYRDTLIQLITRHPGFSRPLEQAVRENARAMSQELADPKSDAGLTIASGAAPPSDRSLIFWYLSPTARFACKPEEAAKTIVQRSEEPTSIPRLGIVKTVDNLSESQDRASVDSAQIGLDVSKTNNEDGTSKKSTTWSVDGTMGLRLTDQAAPTFAYANYTLSRTRVRPAPELAPGAHRNDDDTNGLALGLLVADWAPVPALSVSGSLAYVTDFVKHSQRGVTSIVLQPGFRITHWPVCGWGELQTIKFGPIRLRSMCILEGELDYSHVFKVGRANFAERGNFLALGGAIGIDLAPPLFAKSGVAGSFRYHFLPTISGRAPNVHRWDASLKYRWWVGNGVGIDFGGTYKRGEELKTYTDENEFLLTFGIVV